MNPQDNQQTNPQITPDEAAASLAFATHLQDQMIPRQEVPQEPQNAPQEETEPKVDVKSEIEALRGDFDKKIEDMKKSITDEIKGDIKTALEEDNGQN